MTYMDLPRIGQGVLALWFMVLFILACTSFFRLAMRKNHFMAILASGVAALGYLLVQYCCNITKDNVSHSSSHIPFFFTGVSWMWLLLSGMLFTILNICFLLHIEGWNKTHVSTATLKEGMDDLSAGLCFYAEDGTTILRNRVMDRICLKITGHDLYDGALLEAELRQRMDDISVMTLDDGSVWNLVFHTLQKDGAILHEICAYDITEEYKATRLLMQKQKEVQLTGEKLTRYNRELIQMITAEEILAAKVRIHDELGQGLLLTRKYLLRGGTEGDKEKLLQVLRKNNTLMEKSRSEREKSYLDVILEAASDMGVRLIIDGAIPEKQPVNDVITTAIHENLTNTIRHAKGDEMRVEICNENGFCTAIFTNSGLQPEGPIEERGGIGTLRTLAESAGGELKIEHTPRFRMMLRFYMEE